MSFKISLLPLLTFLAVSALGASSCAEHPLCDFFEATGGKSWTRYDHWLQDVPVCSWYGVHCNNEGVIVALDLTNNNLNGPATVLSRLLAGLPSLTELHLASNKLSGHLSLVPHKEMQVLDLAANLLQGLVPVRTLSSWFQLREMFLSDNAFIGFDDLSANFKGTRCELKGNHFADTIPAWADSCSLEITDTSMPTRTMNAHHNITSVKTRTCSAQTPCPNGQICTCSAWGDNCKSSSQHAVRVDCTGYNAGGQWRTAWCRC